MQEFPNYPLITGFEKSNVLTDWEVGEFLKKRFPSRHLSLVHSIQYIDEYRSLIRDDLPIESIFATGTHLKSRQIEDKNTGRALIEIFQQSLSGNTSAGIISAIAYELGYAVFNNIPNDIKQHWYRITHDQDSEERFCRAYQMYCLEPTKLRDRSEERFDFLSQRVFFSSDFEL